MNQITSEYLFQMIGELVVENKILRVEIARLQGLQKEQETKKNVENGVEPKE